MSKTYNLYIQKSDIKRPSSQEVEEAKLAQKFAIGVYDGNEGEIPSGWKLVKQVDLDNGFHGEAYEKDGKVIIAFRGTNNPKDWDDDIAMWFKQVPAQAKSALDFYYEVEKYCKENGIDKSNITITGHSLGGSSGEIVGSIAGVKTITFNAYGVKDIAEKYNALNLNNINYVTNYGNVNDRTFYTSMHNHVGKTYVLDNFTENDSPKIKKYHKAEYLVNLEDAELYDMSRHHKFEKESMHPDRVLVVEEVMKRENKDHNDAFFHYFLQQAKRGYTMWEREIDKKVSGGDVYVHSYTRDDGTHVSDYYRSYPHR